MCSEAPDEAGLEEPLGHVTQIGKGLGLRDLRTPWDYVMEYPPEETT